MEGEQADDVDVSLFGADALMAQANSCRASVANAGSITSQMISLRPFAASQIPLAS